MLLLTGLANAQSPPDQSWKNLSHIIKESTYTVAMRDSHCVTGHILFFDDSSVTVDSSKLERKDLLRIGDGSSISDHDPIYSGRSSWSDLRHSEPNKHENIEMELKNRSTRKCHSFSATEDEAICDGKKIAKSEVVRGYYIRLAPATEWEHYAVQESVGLLAPRTWFDYAFFPRIKVLLYDVALPEENTKIACR